MKIELKEITVRDLAEGFEEKRAEGGVVVMVESSIFVLRVGDGSSTRTNSALQS